MIAERDLRGEQCRERGRGFEGSAIEATQNLIERFEGARHLEIGELGAPLIAKGGCRFHPATASTSS
ncbi:MAG: hypothetical protein JWM95_3996 [Gemmatimonadetes bacterium]|nr:hypothetical protein [Gemmatimonadota bacterium]